MMMGFVYMSGSYGFTFEVGLNNTRIKVAGIELYFLPHNHESYNEYFKIRSGI
jgi:hypothetical protein